MIKSVLLSAVTSLALSTSGAVAAGGGDQHIVDFDFSFEGPFGKFDQYQLQRGLQVFTEVCSACHGLRHVAFRTLGDEGGPHMDADTVKAYAANFDVYDSELFLRSNTSSHGSSMYFVSAKVLQEMYPAWVM